MVEIGQELPALKCGPITRTTLALFAGASGDPNPIHIDSDFARAAGLEDVQLNAYGGQAGHVGLVLRVVNVLVQRVAAQREKPRLLLVLPAAHAQRLAAQQRACDGARLPRLQLAAELLEQLAEASNGPRRLFVVHDVVSRDAEQLPGVLGRRAVPRIRRHRGEEVRQLLHRLCHSGARKLLAPGAAGHPVEDGAPGGLS